MRYLPILLLSFVLLISAGCKDDEAPALEDVTVVMPVGPDPEEGGSGTGGDSPPTTPETEVVKVLKVDTTLVDGEYSAGRAIPIRIHFSDIVHVFWGQGSDQFPSLNLMVAGNSVRAYYISGRGTDVLVFNYVVQAGDLEELFAYSGVNALELNGSEIVNDDLQPVSLLLPSPGSENSLSANHRISFSVSDSFDGEEISKQWTLYDEDGWDADEDGIDNNDFSRSYVLFDGKLSLIGRGKDVWKNTHKFLSLYLDDQIGDFIYSVKVVSITDSHSWSKSGMMVANNIENLHEGGVYACAVTQKHGIVVQYSSKGTGRINKSVKAKGIKPPVWIRVKKLNDQLYCYYKKNEGDSWTPHPANSIQLDTLEGVFDIGLFSTAHSKKASLRVDFDDFKTQ